MAKSYLRGNEIEFLNDEWVYSDDKTPTIGNERSCGFCGEENTKHGYDGCIGFIPGVMNACCGHGEIKNAYVQFSKNKSIQGNEAAKWIMKRWSQR